MRALLRLLVAPLLIACPAPQPGRVAGARTPGPVCPDAVVIYSSEAGVGRPYARVSVLQVSGDSTFSVSQIHRRLRARAAALGANGIILSATGTELARMAMDRGGAALEAVAIYVPEDTALVLATCRTTPEHLLRAEPRES